MKLRTSAAGIFLGTGILALVLWARPGTTVSAAGTDPHAYFNALIARTDYWKSYTLRDPDQVAGKKYLTYDPANDRDPHRQDAMKVTIPAFYQFFSNALMSDLTASATELVPSDKRRTIWPAGRVIQVDNEIMKVTARVLDAAGNITALKVTRGEFNTAVVAHASGAAIQHATNSLQSDLRLPLMTEDGHSYFFVWDSYWTDSYLNLDTFFTHKAFQFFSGGDDYSIWLEPQASYNKTARDGGYLATHQVRSYNQPYQGKGAWSETNGNYVGPNVADNEPLRPNVPFPIEANTWTRFFVRIDQRPDDYDTLDMWVADETHAPVQTLKGLQISVRPGGKWPNRISGWMIEMNSSTDALTRINERDLVSYVRNFVALRDVADVQPLLVRPLSEPTPAPPRNLRIVR